MEKINLYDFDETIYDGDSSVDFFFYCLKRHKKIIKIFPKMLGSVIKYKTKKITKTEMKEVIFSYLKFVPDVDKYVKDFWENARNNIKPFYLLKDHSQDIIISASPEFLLKDICKELDTKMLIASRVDKKTGKFDGLNCHDVEKVRRLNEKIKNYEVEEAFSDSKSDDPILKLAKNPYYVKGNKLIKAKFEK